MTASVDDQKVIMVRGIDFGAASKAFAAKAKGKGIIELRFNLADSEPPAAITFDCTEPTAVYTEITVAGINALYFVMDGEFEFDGWQFV